ncbi:MAG TPA: hypothetical protein VER55_03025, partial [Ardenticatenaceae bacterium]|nr:hypothetical protein [Ardenticatenaceae bacterium]
EMVSFYNALFAADLQPMAAFGTTLYRGTLHGVPFLICPNTIAGVTALQNRHQFTYDVADVRAIVERARQGGGELMQQDEGVATILDPDGNTMVFQQRIPTT